MLGFGPFDGEILYFVIFHDYSLNKKIQGTTHDSLAADIVGLDDLLIEHFSFEDGKISPIKSEKFNLILGTQFNLFLDAGYRVGHSMITPFRVRRDMTQAELEWNR